MGSPEGNGVFDWTSAEGLPTSSMNLAAGASSAAHTLEQWKQSDGQCKIMMATESNRFAVAHAYAASSTFKHYWAEMFAADHGLANSTCYAEAALSTRASSGVSESGDE